MPLDAQEILNNPREWAPLSREDALRNSHSGRVAVVFVNHGLQVAASFGPETPFFLADGPYDYESLRYFARVAAPGVRPAPRPKLKPPPPKEEAEDTEPVESGVPEEAEVEEAAPATTEVEIKITELEAACFAPGVETLNIHFEITGDLAKADTLHLRVASEEKPDVFWVDRKLDLAPKATGVFAWDGAVDGDSLGGYINLEQSPYLVQLGLTPKGGAAKYTNKAKVKVELMQVEIQVGDDLQLGEEEKDKEAVKALREEVKKNGGKGKVRLDGATFKEKSAEMNGTKSYSESAAYLGKGPGIPLFVNLWVKGKGGAKKRSPRGVHGTKILWDVLPDDKANFDHGLDERKVHAKAKKFIQGVSTHENAETAPPGWTCHSWVGGMREKAEYIGESDKHWKGLLDKWNMGDLDKRVWATSTFCRVTAESDADSGILYYNGKIAGDRFWITAFADLKGELDQADVKIGQKVGAECKSQVLAFLNWKDVKVTKSYKSGADAVSLGFEDANKEFNKAAMSIINKPGLSHEDIRADWAKHTKAKYAEYAPHDAFVKDAIEENPGPWAVCYRGYNDYWNRTHPGSGFFGRLWNRIKAFFGAADEDSYKKKCDEYVFGWLYIVAKKFPVGEAGLTCFKFETNGAHNHEGGTYTAGVAPDIDRYTTRHQAVLFVFKKGNPTHTVVHEMGHNLFLAHGPGHFDSGKQPGGYQPNAHNKDEICLMSYHPDGDSFCGYCLVKLAGWDIDHVVNDGTLLTLA